ncbi:uncharacterized protein LOC124198124 [Daphnia pulex]|uniref:uncharacterized protein LOC124198124 n=1 Tax=Daphnia pulex TaxID=6669 RepID=UPI001EE10DD0|nr:uncharacterized protein LOC124198124 [Daphnia pulex]
MYKPVPQVHSSNEGEDSESELFNSSTLNFDEKSPQYDHSGGVAPQQMEKPSMSAGRKIALAFSIANCVAFIILFLWILPCEYDTCKATHSVKTKDWEVNLTGKGVQAMGMASSLTSKSKEMLILLSSKTTHSISSSYCFSNESNNLLGIRAADGKLVWEKNFTEAIQYLNCSLIDVDNDGVDDCLLFPVVKSLSALNSLTGSLMWQFQIPREDLKIKPAAELRIIDIEAFADLNNDAISDIAVIMGDSKAQFFIGISGSNGELLWQFSLNTTCIPTDQSISIHSVLSNSCFKEPEFGKTNVTSRFLSYGRSPSAPNFPPCLKCDALTSGIPKTRYLFHRSANDFLIRAMVNCSTLGTIVKKTIFDI